MMQRPASGGMGLGRNTVRFEDEIEGYDDIVASAIDDLDDDDDDSGCGYDEDDELAELGSSVWLHGAVSDDMRLHDDNIREESDYGEIAGAESRMLQVDGPQRGKQRMQNAMSLELAHGSGQTRAAIASHDDDDDANDEKEGDQELLQKLQASAKEDEERARQEVFEEVLSTLRRTRSGALDRARRGMADLEEYYESELDEIRAELDRKEVERQSAVSELQILRSQQHQQQEQDQRDQVVGEVQTVEDPRPMIGDGGSGGVGEADSRAGRIEHRSATNVAEDDEAEQAFENGQRDHAPASGVPRAIGADDTGAATRSLVAPESPQEWTTRSERHGGDGEMKKLRDHLAAATASGNAQSKKVVTLEAQLAAREEEIASLENDAAMARSDAIEQRQEMEAQAVAAEHRHRHEMAEAVAESKKLRRMLSELEEERREDRECIKVLETHNAKIDDELTTSKRTAATTGAALMLGSQENESLRRQVEAMKLELQRASVQLAEATRRMHASEDRCAEMESKYSELQVSALRFREQEAAPRRRGDHLVTTFGLPNSLDRETAREARKIVTGAGTEQPHRARQRGQNSSQARQLLEQNASGTLEPGRPKWHGHQSSAAVDGRIRGGEDESVINLNAARKMQWEVSSEDVQRERLRHERLHAPDDGHIFATFDTEGGAPHSSEGAPSASTDGGARVMGVVGGGATTTATTDCGGSHIQDSYATTSAAAMHNKENNEEPGVPFATEKTLRESMELTSEIDRALMELNLEREQLERELAKMPIHSGKTMAARRRKAETEGRLDEIGRSIARYKMMMRRMHVL